MPASLLGPSRSVTVRRSSVISRSRYMPVRTVSAVCWARVVGSRGKKDRFNSSSGIGIVQRPPRRHVIIEQRFPIAGSLGQRGAGPDRALRHSVAVGLAQVGGVRRVIPLTRVNLCQEKKRLLKHPGSVSL